IDAHGQFVDDTTATATAPQHPAGPVDIVLTNSDGMSATFSQGYSYNPAPNPPPVISFISPNHGATAGGSVIKVVGDNYQQDAKIILDGRALDTTFIDQNSLSATTPLHNPGPVRIAVANPDGLSVGLDDGFTFEGSIPLPVIKLTFPVGGEVFGAGGASLSITWTIESN